MPYIPAECPCGAPFYTAGENGPSAHLCSNCRALVATGAMPRPPAPPRLTIDDIRLLAVTEGGRRRAENYNALRHSILALHAARPELTANDIARKFGLPLHKRQNKFVRSTLKGVTSHGVNIAKRDDFRRATAAAVLAKYEEKDSSP